VELESSSYDDSEVERTELESGSESGSGIIITVYCEDLLLHNHELIS
jgi:hypothetical protein